MPLAMFLDTFPSFAILFGLSMDSSVVCFALVGEEGYIAQLRVMTRPLWARRRETISFCFLSDDHPSLSTIYLRVAAEVLLRSWSRVTWWVRVYSLEKVFRFWMGGSCVDWCEPVSKFKACFQVDEAAKLEEVGK